MLKYKMGDKVFIKNDIQGIIVKTDYKITIFPGIEQHFDYAVAYTNENGKEMISNIQEDELIPLQPNH